MRPPVVASPCCCVAASKSIHFVPPPATARCFFASTSTVFIADRSITTPSSHVEKPAMLCAPPAYSDRQPLARREAHGLDHILGRLHPDDECGFLVDRVVPDHASLVVVLVPRSYDAAGKRPFELADCCVPEYVSHCDSPP